MAIFGWGKFALISKNADDTKRRLFAGPYAEFSIEGENEEAEARGWIEGKNQQTSSAITSETYTMTLAFQETDWQMMQLAFGEEAENTASINVPAFFTGEVPSVAPYTVDVAGVTSTSEMYAAIQGVNAQHLSVVEAAPGVGEVQRGSGNLTFNAGQAGQPFSVSYFKTFSSIPTIGYASEITEYSDFEFMGQGYSPNFGGGILIYCPSVSRTSLPGLSAEDVSNFELTFSLSVPSGRRVPYQIVKLPSA